MSEQPPQPWLERLLAAEAERAIPDDLDLWPGISQRLRERGPEVSSPSTANGAIDARDLRTLRTERWALPFAARIRQRSGELIGAAITVGLAALVIAVFAIIAGWPEADRGQLGFGNDLPEQGIPVRSTPDCNFDLDVSLETREDNVQVKVQARSNWGCADTGTLRLTIVDASGERAAIAGNPLTLPLTAEGQERRADSTVLWSNWCGERGRFRVETSFGDEQRLHALPEAPRCVEQNRPSTLRASATSAASATPEMPATQGTPIP
jgi:hypothetical protein